MAISQQQLKHILALSKLNADESELSKFEADLNNIIKLFDNIQNVDTTGVPAMISPLTSHFIARQDNAIEQHSEPYFKEIAPKYEAHHFIVPKVIE